MRRRTRRLCDCNFCVSRLKQCIVDSVFLRPSQHSISGARSDGDRSLGRCDTSAAREKTFSSESHELSHRKRFS